MKYFLQDINEFLKARIDSAVLIFRIVVGCMFMWHGFPKIIGGIDVWSGLGQALAVFGITVFPVFFGFMSGAIEFFGGMFLFLGFFYRFACFFLFANMMTAFSTQMMGDKGLAKAAQSLEDGFSFFAAIAIGPGRYSLDYKLKWIRNKW